jgi:hypothetical protein
MLSKKKVESNEANKLGSTKTAVSFILTAPTSSFGRIQKLIKKQAL